MITNIVSSREVLAITGISRSTLNNYIKMGLLPTPLVRKPLKGYGQVRRLGYFPVWVIDRIKEIRELKGAGLAMDEIVKKLKGEVPLEVGDVSGNLSLVGEGTLSELNMCVLALAVQNGDDVYRRVLPEDYISIMGAVQSIFEKTVVSFGGMFMKGMMYTFLSVFLLGEDYVEKALRCALALRENVKTILAEWGKRIGCDIFFGIAISHGAHVPMQRCKFTASCVVCSGGIINHAIYLSHLMKNGEVYATKETIMGLPPGKRNVFRYGITKKGKGLVSFVDGVFARSTESIEKSVPEMWKEELANLWVTCILDYRYPLFNGESFVG